VKIRIDEKLKLYWKNYLFQTVLATLVVFVLLLILSLREAVIIASIGASAFIVFAMPEDLTAKPRRLIGGHIVGVVSGALFTLVPRVSCTHLAIAASLAVGLSIFIMVITDTEHPPAAGTALGIASRSFSFGVAAAVIVSAIFLSVVHHLFRSRLKNLV